LKDIERALLIANEVIRVNDWFKVRLLLREQLAKVTAIVTL